MVIEQREAAHEVEKNIALRGSARNHARVRGQMEIAMVTREGQREREREMEEKTNDRLHEH